MSDTTVQPDFEGRKVFFLYPTASVQNQIITELIQQEYEVYTSKNHAHIVRALKKHTDSVIFVNIDEGQSEEEWEKWFNTLKNSLPNLQFGVFSSNTSDELRDKYQNEIKISCGFMNLKLDMSKTTERIFTVLEKLNVKGRRKYIRASTEDEPTATINIPFGGSYTNGSIKDISVVGFSCTFDQDPGFRKNSLYKDMQIRLKTMLLKVEAVMFGSRKSNNDDTIYVFLFTQRIDPEVRVKIRKYIQQNLQSKMDTLIH